MTKPKSAVPYVFAFLLTVISVLMRGLLYTPSIFIRAFVFFVAVIGLWYLIEWLLDRTEHKLLQTALVIMGVSFYIGLYTIFNDSIMHLITVGELAIKPSDLARNMYLISLITTILIVSIRWSKARESVQIENLTLQSEHIGAQFELLRKQVNPQFLFYCLTTLKTMVQNDDPQTESYILKLANVYRQTLKKDRNLVPLKQELSLLDTYMFLMRKGRESAITFEVSVNSDSLTARVPVFALQTLCDNSIKHNTFSENEPLNIRIFQQNDQSVTIANNYKADTDFTTSRMDIDYLEMRYMMEGIEKGVANQTEAFNHAVTIQLI